MSRGPRSAPPDLPGFTPDRWIGGGGFADVFLYTQLRPSRSVAVKILRREHLSAQALTQFDAEADIMAEVSTHPYIVTIFASGVSPDGRPYIVMEHYPQPNFGERARGGTLDLSDVLRTGIQVAAAVETAHRAGIIHRDIKPANILTSAFGRPGLTDFGISGVQSEGGISEAVGITVAYTAPELLNEETSGSVATDVYGLGATISALAAGHSPFWSPSGDNGDQAVLARALSGQVAPLTRPDVPKSLNHLLTRTMDPAPNNRPTSAVALAQDLQEIEQELRLQPTPIEVAAAPESRKGKRKDDDPDDKDRTRRSIQVVNPHAPSAPAGAPPAPAAPDIPIVAASSPVAPPPTFAAPTTSASPPPASPVTGVPTGLMPPASTGDDDPTRARSAPIAAAPASPRVPAISRREPTPEITDDTVARPRSGGHAPFAPPAVDAPAPATPPPPDDAPAPAASTDVPPSERSPRRSIPWKPIGAVAALAIAVIAVVAIISSSGRNSKAGPGTDTAPAGPIQSIDTGPGAVSTPTDPSLSSFTMSADGSTATASLTWTPDHDSTVTERIQVAPMKGGSAATQTGVDGPAGGKLPVVLTFDASGACTGATVGSQAVPLSFCGAGPPCFQLTGQANNRASGNPVVAQAAGSDNPDATLLKTKALTVTTGAYDNACSSAFSGSS